MIQHNSSAQITPGMIQPQSTRTGKDHFECQHIVDFFQLFFKVFVFVYLIDDEQFSALSYKSIRHIEE